MADQPPRTGTNWAAIGTIGGLVGLALTVLGLYLAYGRDGGGASASVSVDSVTGGQVIGWVTSVSGDGFEPNEQVQETLGGSLLSTAVASTLGHVFFVYTVPKTWTAGSYELVLKGLGSQRSASATLVLPP